MALAAVYTESGVRLCAAQYLWTAITFTAAVNPARYAHCSVVLNGNILVIGGKDNMAVQYNDVWRSSDGVAWERLTAAAGFSARYTMGCALFESQVVVLCGYGSTYLGDLWASSDGSSWTQMTATVSPARYQTGVAVFLNKLWVIAGFKGWTGGGPYLNDVWYLSTLSGSWQSATGAAAFSTRYGMGTTVLDTKMWIAAGYDSSTSIRDVLRLDRERGRGEARDVVFSSF